MTWTPRQRIAFPASLITQANALAALIDPDTGGALTFDSERTVNDLVVAEIPFKSDFWPIVERRDPAEWKAVIPQLAESFGREPIPDATITRLCAAILLNDEIPSDETA